jgi:hypothetical protein
VSQVEVNEMLRLWRQLVSLDRAGTLETLTMRDKASKVPSHDAMPCGTLLAVKLSMRSVLACPPH